jgi:hypothetical protein
MKLFYDFVSESSDLSQEILFDLQSENVLDTAEKIGHSFRCFMFRRMKVDEDSLKI